METKIKRRHRPREQNSRWTRTLSGSLLTNCSAANLQSSALQPTRRKRESNCCKIHREDAAINSKKKSSYLPTSPLTITTRCSGQPPCCDADAASQRSSPPRTYSASTFFPLATGSLKQAIHRSESAFRASVVGSRVADRGRNPNLTKSTALGQRIQRTPGIPNRSQGVRSIESAASIRRRGGREGGEEGFRRSQKG